MLGVLLIGLCLFNLASSSTISLCYLVSENKNTKERYLEVYQEQWHGAQNGAVNTGVYKFSTQRTTSIIPDRSNVSPRNTQIAQFDLTVEFQRLPHPFVLTLLLVQDSKVSVVSLVQ